MALPSFILPGDEAEFRSWCRSVNPTLVTEQLVDTAISIHDGVITTLVFVPPKEERGLDNFESIQWLSNFITGPDLAPYRMTQPVIDPELREELFVFYRRFDRLYPGFIDLEDFRIKRPDPTPYLPRAGATQTIVQL